MEAGALDHRIEFRRSTLTDDGFGQVQAAPSAIGTVWASKQDISDGERFRAGMTSADITTRFQVRWSPFAATIVPGDSIRCDGRNYSIVGIKEMGRRIGLEITTSAVADLPLE